MAVRKVGESVNYAELIDDSLKTNLEWDKILVCDGLSPTEILNLALTSNFRSICQSSHPSFVKDLNTSAYLSGKQNKFVEFPVSSILDPANVSKETEEKFSKFTKSFSSSSQKRKLLDDLRTTLEAMKISQSLQSDIVLVSDELITNAIFNAPFVDLENSQSGFSRKASNVKMEDGKTATYFVGSDEERIIIGCKDPYGTLNLTKLFERIKRCYDTGVAANINLNSQSSAGAGIGSFMVFDVAESIYINVEESLCTMICVSFHIKMSSRKRIALPKNLNFVIKKQGA